MASALTYLLAGLGGGVPGFAKGYGDAETERKTSAKKLLLEAMELGAPSDRIGALYKAANAPGTIESLFGAKGPSEEAAKTYGVDYSKAMARKRREKVLELLPKDLDPKTRMAMLKEHLNFDTMQDEPAPVTAPVTPAPAPVVTPQAPSPPQAAPPSVQGPPLPVPYAGAGAPIPAMPSGGPMTPEQEAVISEATPPQDLEELMPEAKVVTTLPGNYPGMLAPGNIDLDSRKVLKNKDGSISTELTFSTNIEGREILLPMVVDGKKVSKDEAIKHFMATGKHLGAFSTPAAATAYAEQLHDRQATQYGQPKAEAAPAPAPPAAPEDPRKVAYRKFFTSSGGLKEGAPLEMEKKPLDYLTTVNGVSIFQDPETGATSTQRLVPNDAEDPESWPSYTEEVRDPKTHKVYEERVFYKTDPMKPVGRRRVKEVDKPVDKPEGAWILDKATGTEVWSRVKYGTRRPKEEKDTSLQDLLKYTRIDSILAGEFPGGAILRGPDYLARRQTLLNQSGLPDDTGLPPPKGGAAPKAAAAKPSPPAKGGKAAPKDHSGLWK